MRSRKFLSAVVTGALTVGLVGVAIGETQAGTDVAPPAAAPAAPQSSPSNAGADHQVSRAALRAHLERGGDGYLRGSDWASAQSFAVPGTKLRGWTFQQQSGKRCLALPDPIVEGYGVKCSTSTEIADGVATVVLIPPASTEAPSIVGVLTSGTRTASVDAPDGDAGILTRIGDVYAGSAPVGSRLITDAGSQTLNPPKHEYVEAVPAPASGY